jgi:hypothetical protein
MIAVGQPLTLNNTSASDIILATISQTLSLIFNDTLTGIEGKVDEWLDQLADYVNQYNIECQFERQQAIAAALPGAEYLSSEVYTDNGSDYYHGFRLAGDVDTMIDPQPFAANGYQIKWVQVQPVNNGGAWITVWVAEA